MQSHDTSEWGLTERKTIAGFSIKEFSQPPYRRLPWHEHDDASICFVASGSYTELARGQERECGPQSMVFKPAAERHADHFGRLGGTCLLIEINSGRLESIEPFSDITTKPNVTRNSKLAAFGFNIYQEFTAGDVCSPLAIEGLVLEVLAEASRSLVEESTTREPAWLRKACDLIRDTFREPITLSSVAHAIDVHPSHLARRFREQYHRSIGDYVRHLRIEHAARELADSSASLTEIALRWGFFDQSHFSRVFKRHTGVTPARFRLASRACTSLTSRA